MKIIKITLLMIFILSCSAKRTEGTLAGDCSDGADNDQDGLFDCDDDSCIGSSDCDLPTSSEEDDEEEDDEEEDDEEEDDEEEDDDGISSLYDPTLVGNVESGASLYLSNCSGCHGSSGLGSSGPSLRESVQEEDDEELWEVILEGEDDMPAIVLQPQQVADIVAWLRSIFPS